MTQQQNINHTISLGSKTFVDEDLGDSNDAAANDKKKKKKKNKNKKKPTNGNEASGPKSETIFENT